MNKPKPAIGLQPSELVLSAPIPAFAMEELTTTIPVILRRAAKVFEDPDEEAAVDWPSGWRLPLQGELIHLRKDFGGFVSTIDFDLERKIAVIHLR